jgi:hypothetical protein
MNAQVTYKTHILIGVRENTVIADRPHTLRTRRAYPPAEAIRMHRINDARNGYVSFALCTPTSHHALPLAGERQGLPTCRTKPLSN